MHVPRAKPRRQIVFDRLVERDQPDRVALPRQEEVFSERQSILFKRLRVVRMVDSKRHTLVYLTYSDKLVEGSPQNAVAAVPVDRAVALPVKP